MLFRKNVDPLCLYCQRAKPLDGDNMICIKAGIVNAGDKCKYFKYDPLKRTPPRPVKVDFSKFSDEDFEL